MPSGLPLLRMMCGQLGGKHLLCGSPRRWSVLSRCVVHSHISQCMEPFPGLGSGLSAGRGAVFSSSPGSDRSSHPCAHGLRPVACPLQLSASSSVEWAHSGHFTRGTFSCFRDPALSGELSRFLDAVVGQREQTSVASRNSARADSAARCAIGHTCLCFLFLSYKMWF